MSIRKLKLTKERRKQRTRHKLKGGLRISVFRSLNNIYAQLIDDESHSTIASFSSLQLDSKGDKSEIAKEVGKELAKVALKKGVDRAVFDRGPYLYHGRVKSLVDGLREGGLNI